MLGVWLLDVSVWCFLRVCFAFSGLLVAGLSGLCVFRVFWVYCSEFGRCWLLV